MSSVAYRLASPGDGELLQPVLEQSIRNPADGLILGDEVAEVMASIEGSTEPRSERKYFVAYDWHQGQLLGVMGFQKPSEDMLPFATAGDKTAELINAYVDLEARGQDIGKNLVGWLGDLASGRAFRHEEFVVNSGPRYRDTGWPFWTKVFGEPVGSIEDKYGAGNHAMVWRGPVYQRLTKI